MKMKFLNLKTNLLLSFILTSLFLLGNTNEAEQSPSIAVSKTPDGIKTTINSTTISVSFYNPSTARIVKYPEGTNPVKESLSVIAEPERVDLKTSQKGDYLNIRSSELEVKINKKNGVVTFYSSDGKLLISEKGAPRFNIFDDAGVETFDVAQTFQLDEKEAIYGLGQLQNGKMSQRGTTKKLIQGNTEDVITFFQ
ncbi:MAG: DUF4968 domain-containing protein, partial [Candidatus Cloacimonetes bacterium]|nr:DUF4968 domain-containing protein [Candidatus Cloacimonadota bacterium]